MNRPAPYVRIHDREGLPQPWLCGERSRCGRRVGQICQGGVVSDYQHNKAGSKISERVAVNFRRIRNRRVRLKHYRHTCTLLLRAETSRLKYAKCRFDSNLFSINREGRVERYLTEWRIR